MISRNAFLLILLLVVPLSGQTSDWAYTFRPGDSMWDISNKYLISNKYHKQLLVLNKIDNSNDILPGTIIKIPVKWLKKQPSSALVLNTFGKVTIIHAAENMKNSDVDFNQRLYAGDRIITGPESSATLIFADKSRLILHANSELIMDSLSQYGDSGMVDTSLRLPTGSVDSHVNPKKGPATRYQITTPAAVAAVRGTVFRMSSDAVKLIARGEVLKGKIGVSAQDKTTIVPEGFGSVTEKGKVPQKPRKLLSPPDTSETITKVLQLPAKFSWQSLTGAKTYRIQVFPKETPGKVLIDKIRKPASIPIDFLADGEYVLRVRGTDNIGLEGLNRNHMFTVETKPVKPAILNTENDVDVTNTNLVLKWTADKRASRYHIQLSSDSEFKQIILEQADIKTNHFKAEIDSEAKKFYWRVAGINKKGVQGSYSDSAKIITNTEPGPFLFNYYEFDNYSIYFEWFPVKSKGIYHFQIKPVNSFYGPMREFIVYQPFIWIKRPPNGDYIFRVRDAGHTSSSDMFSEWHSIRIFSPYYLPIPNTQFPFR